MISQLQTPHFTLRDVCKLLPGRPSVSTLWRWINRGVRGERLSTVKIGGTNYVSEAELERFLRAINGGRVAATVTAKARAKQLATVDRELDRELEG
jgi:formamidopyrimidine-DNA glycosylase